jgi:alanine-synthesizing transaminase
VPQVKIHFLTEDKEEFMEEFERIKRLPPYVFAIVNDLKMKLRREGEDIIDLGMGNPDIPTPQHIVDKVAEAVYNPRNHRYSASKGIYKLRTAICDKYKEQFGVDLDPETEAIATIGVKEGYSHLVLAITNSGTSAIVPNPCYPIHSYAIIIAGGDVRSVPFEEGRDFIEEIEKVVKNSWPIPGYIVLSFPHNPTTLCVDIEFFEKIVDFAKENNMFIIHDLAYADIAFDGYKPPSILQVKGAKDCCVEFYSMSKTYSMAGWRLGFALGNKKLIHALTRIKSYLDYGVFQPLQIAAITALKSDQSCVQEINEIYKKRRDKLVEGLNKVGWEVTSPKATMFLWAKIPEQYIHMGSLEFSKFLINEAKVAVSPGIGFGEYGDKYVRFALVENEMRIQQAVRGIKKIFK